MNSSRRQAGFTLIELMSVVGIIGILLGIYVGNAISATEETRAFVCEKNRVLYEEAEGLFQLREGRPSTTLLELVEKNYLSRATCPRGGVLTWEVTDPESPAANKTLVCSLHGPRSRINAWPALLASGEDGFAFLDSFDEDVPAGWSQAKGKYWEIVDGKYRAGRPGKRAGEHRSFAGSEEWEDYSVSMKATLHQGQGYGVYFRASDPDAVDGYVFQYDSAFKGGSFLFRKLVNGKQEGAFASVKAGEDYDWYGSERQIKIEVVGNTYTAYVDGEAVLTGEDSTYSQGGIGLRVWGKGMADFDEVEVDLED